MGMYIQKDFAFGEIPIEPHLELVMDLISRLGDEVELIRANIYLDYPAEPVGKKMKSVEIKEQSDLKKLKEECFKLGEIYKINIELELKLKYGERIFDGYIIIYDQKNSRGFCDIEFDIYPSKEIKGIRDFIRLIDKGFLGKIKKFAEENKKKIRAIEIYPSQLDYEENPESLLYFYSRNPSDLIKSSIKYLALKRRDLINEKIKAYNENFLINVLWRIKEVPEGIGELAKVQGIEFSKGSISLSSFKEEGVRSIFDYILNKIVIPGLNPLEDKGTISSKMTNSVSKTLKTK